MFHLVEELLLTCDSQMTDLIGAGLLESLQNLAGHRGLDEVVFMPFLGLLTHSVWFDIIAGYEAVMLHYARRELIAKMRRLLLP